MRKFNRRRLILGAGATLLVSNNQQANSTPDVCQPKFASACKFDDGSYGAVVLDRDGKILNTIELPARGHDVLFDNRRKQVITFARRPGNFAIAAPIDGKGEPRLFTSDQGRHFYGHGVLSNDGKLLFCSENKFSTGEGKIGIYDVENRFSRIAEFDSFGTGPHQLSCLPQRDVLVVCNGGIKTHPSTARAKLNLDQMRPSLVFIDMRDGHLMEKHELPKDQHKLSIRHLAITSNSEIIFGCQNQSKSGRLEPLIGRVTLGQSLKLFRTPDSILRSLENYIGSVAVSPDTEYFSVTSSRGNTNAVFSLKTGNLVRHEALDGASGSAWHDNVPFASSSKGMFGHADSRNKLPIKFDNHLSHSIDFC